LIGQLKKGKKYKRLKMVVIVLVMLVAGFWGYVEIANRNSKNMTGRQKVSKAVYPLLIWWANLKGLGTKKLYGENVVPVVSFYSLKDTLIDGRVYDFEQLKGKKVMLVNTASDCGYTSQYDALQKLSEKYKDKLVVIGFPANDFKEEEKGTDAEIAAFCKLNFGVTFPMMKKSSVKRGSDQNKVFQWLCNPEKNGWSSQVPSWNFCKYIVDEQGRLTNFFASTIEPFDKEIINALNH
jgi:glutathione peroxidase